MLYHWYELNHAAVGPARAALDTCRMLFENPFNPMAHTAFGRATSAACQMIERTTRNYTKPEFGLGMTMENGKPVTITQEIVWRRAFCNIIHFKRESAGQSFEAKPRLLLVAPMSGHYATLLRGTVETLLPNFDVYITDWRSAGDVPVAQGSFDLDDYITYVMDMIAHFRGDVHVVAVCQSAVPALAGVALMERRKDPDVPASLILLGGPVDPRISKTAVNELAEERGTQWFADNVISRVPWTNRGFGRSVYPGFLQLSGFMSMNPERHMQAHQDMFFHLVEGDGERAEKHRDFYDEYLAVMDLTAEFFLQTIDKVFVRHELPRGQMRHHGEMVDLSDIKRVAMMTVEGERDDITGRGQCATALDLCRSLSVEKKMHFECPAVGHYGIFNGTRFRNEIAPRLAKFINLHDRGVKQPQKMPTMVLAN